MKEELQDFIRDVSQMIPCSNFCIAPQPMFHLMENCSEIMTYMSFGQSKRKCQVRHNTLEKSIISTLLSLKCLISSKIWKNRHDKKKYKICFHQFFILIFMILFFNSLLKKLWMTHYIILPGTNAKADILIINLPQYYQKSNLLSHLYNFSSVSDSSCAFLSSHWQMWES